MFGKANSLTFTLEMAGMPVGSFSGIEQGGSSSETEAHPGFKSLTGMDSETDVVEFKQGNDVVVRKKPGRASGSTRVAAASGAEGNGAALASAVDFLTWKQPAGAGTTKTLKLVGFVPLGNAHRFIKSRSGHLLNHDSGQPGRIILGSAFRPAASWRFAEGRAMNAGSRPILVGSTLSVLLYHRAFRRG